MTIPSITLNTGRVIGQGFPAYIVAEIGSNHDGDLERAKTLVVEAKTSGADAVKFQSYQVQNLLNPICQTNGRWAPDPTWETFKRLSIPEEWHAVLQAEASNVGIDFLSTPYDLDRLQLLLDLDVPAIKIASGDLTFHELIHRAGESGKPVFLSTGHATLGEVEAALEVLWETGCKDIVVLHGASAYPASFDDANIPAMVTMQQGFLVQVGCSDHTLGSSVPLGAIARGASVIEKHLTDDKTRPGVDHAFSLDGEGFAMMVQQVRQLEAALVPRTKSPRPAESHERIMARRAIYACTSIPAGTPIQRGMVRMVRHAYPEGVSADNWHRVMNVKAARDIAEGELITWEII